MLQDLQKLTTFLKYNLYSIGLSSIKVTKSRLHNEYVTMQYSILHVHVASPYASFMSLQSYFLGHTATLCLLCAVHEHIERRNVWSTCVEAYALYSTLVRWHGS